MFKHVLENVIPKLTDITTDSTEVDPVVKRNFDLSLKTLSQVMSRNM
jgi:hypothetical protein